MSDIERKALQWLEAFSEELDHEPEPIELRSTEDLLDELRAVGLNPDGVIEKVKRLLAGNATVADEVDKPMFQSSAFLGCVGSRPSRCSSERPTSLVLRNESTGESRATGRFSLLDGYTESELAEKVPWADNCVQIAKQLNPDDPSQASYAAKITVLPDTDKRQGQIKIVLESNDSRATKVKLRGNRSMELFDGLWPADHTQVRFQISLEISDE